MQRFKVTLDGGATMIVWAETAKHAKIIAMQLGNYVIAVEQCDE